MLETWDAKIRFSRHPHLDSRESEAEGAILAEISALYTTAFHATTSRYHSALSLGVRFSVLKST